MSLKEADRKRDSPMSAADAAAWFAALRWRKEAHLLLQRIEEHAAEKSRLQELGKAADRKYSGLLDEWNQRVDPATRQPRESCPEQPPELFLSTLQEPERPLFEEDYRLWIERRLWTTRADCKEPQPASRVFRLWVLFPVTPMSFFVAEQLLIDNWHEQWRDLESQAASLCRELAGLLSSVKHSVRLIGVKKTRRNEAAASSALEVLDKAILLAGSTRSEASSLLKELARHLDEVRDVLWRSDYGSLLSGELARQTFERALACGELREDYEHGQLQAHLAQLLDREGIPVPQHVAYAASTWTEAYENRQSGSGPEENLSRWWGDAVSRRSKRQTSRR